MLGRLVYNMRVFVSNIVTPKEGKHQEVDNSNDEYEISLDYVLQGILNMAEDSQRQIDELYSRLGDANKDYDGVRKFSDIVKDTPTDSINRLLEDAFPDGFPQLDVTSIDKNVTEISKDIANGMTNHMQESFDLGRAVTIATVLDMHANSDMSTEDVMDVMGAIMDDSDVLSDMVHEILDDFGTD